MKMGFERCHPAVNLIYFTMVVAGMISFQHPVFLTISFLCACAYSIKRNGKKAILLALGLLPLTIAFALYYSSYHHFGVTVLRQNFIGNNMTLESLLYGLALGVSIAGVIIWMSCVYSVFSADKVVYLFGRLSPRLSLYLAILLRMVPRLNQEAKKINMAQRGIGRGVDQGTAWRRFCNGIRVLSMLITWVIGALAAASESMRSRGSSLRGRTAFSIYRFDNRDRAYVIALFGCITVTLMGVILKQTDMVYAPSIIWKPLTPMFCISCVGYTILCLMPLGLELWTEYRFHQARRKI